MSLDGLELFDGVIPPLQCTKVPMNEEERRAFSFIFQSPLLMVDLFSIG